MSRPPPMPVVQAVRPADAVSVEAVRAAVLADLKRDQRKAANSAVNAGVLVWLLFGLVGAAFSPLVSVLGCGVAALLGVVAMARGRPFQGLLLVGLAGVTALVVMVD